MPSPPQCLIPGKGRMQSPLSLTWLSNQSHNCVSLITVACICWASAVHQAVCKVWQAWSLWILTTLQAGFLMLWIKKQRGLSRSSSYFGNIGRIRLQYLTPEPEHLNTALFLPLMNIHHALDPQTNNKMLKRRQISSPRSWSAGDNYDPGCTAHTGCHGNRRGSSSLCQGA